jgi:hypothetical protein
MGRSPVRGYVVRDDLRQASGLSVLVHEMHTNNIGHNSLRLPKDPDDMLAFVRMLLSVTHGELAALALTQTPTVIKDAD